MARQKPANLPRTLAAIGWSPAAVLIHIRLCRSSGYAVNGSEGLHHPVPRMRMRAFYPPAHPAAPLALTALRSHACHFSIAALLQSKYNLGSSVLRNWSRSCIPACNGLPDVPPRRIDYRTPVGRFAAGRFPGTRRLLSAGGFRCHHPSSIPRDSGRFCRHPPGLRCPERPLLWNGTSR